VEEAKVKVINEKCEKSAADDKTLPKSAYLVTYVKEEKITYDIVMADSRVEIFDHYWDTYKEGLQSISWTRGTVNPRQWNSNNPSPPKKKVTKKPRKRDE
tara:strand:+ start:265 stop:564 length:300 start_codon:yes stop_codon:yes gene_type:complete